MAASGYGDYEVTSGLTAMQRMPPYGFSRVLWRSETPVDGVFIGTNQKYSGGVSLSMALAVSVPSLCQGKQLSGE